MTDYKIGDNTGDDFSGTEDSHNRSDSTTTNFGGALFMWWSEFNAGVWRHGLVKFSGLDSVSDTYKVATATFYVYQFNHAADDGDHDFDVHRLLQNWVEAEVTWDVYSTGNNWNTAGPEGSGSDFSSTATISSWTIGQTDGAWYNFSNAQLAADVEDMIDGTVGNYGWRFKRVDGPGTSDYKEMRSSEGTDGERPYLLITEAAGGARHVLFVR